MSASVYLKVATLMSVACVIVLFFLVLRLLELPAAVQSTVSLESATRASASAGAATATATATATAAPNATGVSAIALQYPNVHSAPALGAPVLGVLSRGTQVDVAGRSSDAAWLQIHYPDGPNGVGWVSTSLMSVNGSTSSLPVVGSP